MSVKISPEQLSAEIIRQLSAFAGATNEVLDHAATVATEHAKTELNTKSPSLSGKYGKSWKVKKGKMARVGGVCEMVVYNKNRYQLTHLLEHGHAKVVFGKRTGGRVPPKVHIAPVEKETVKEFEELVMEGIRNAAK